MTRAHTLEIYNVFNGMDTFLTGTIFISWFFIESFISERQGRVFVQLFMLQNNLSFVDKWPIITSNDCEL